MGHHDGGTLQFLHHMGHGEGLARARDPQQGLRGKTRPQPFHQLPDGLRLVAGRLETGLYLERFGHG